MSHAGSWARSAAWGAEESAALAHRVAGRLAGERGRDAVQLAGLAIRGVALGVGVTAIVQSLLGGLGLALAGIPFAGLLTAVMFMLCIAQIGPVPVLVPAALWLFWNDQTVWGVVLLVLAGVVATLDNVLRPVLIRMGADLSLLLIFAGVIGGLLAALTATRVDASVQPPRPQKPRDFARRRLSAGRKPAEPARGAGRPAGRLPRSRECPGPGAGRRTIRESRVLRLPSGRPRPAPQGAGR